MWIRARRSWMRRRARRTLPIHELSLDLGAVAKGYTAERVAQWMLDSEMPSFIISAGGNVRCGQKPLDGRDRWGVSIQDPGPIDGLPGTGYMDVLYLTNLFRRYQRRLSALLHGGRRAVSSSDRSRYAVSRPAHACRHHRHPGFRPGRRAEHRGVPDALRAGTRLCGSAGRRGSLLGRRWTAACSAPTACAPTLVLAGRILQGLRGARMNLYLLEDLPPLSQDTAVCLGTFDGVHLGHQALARQTVQAARQEALIPCA